MASVIDTLMRDALAAPSLTWLATNANCAATETRTRAIPARCSWGGGQIASSAATESGMALAVWCGHRERAPAAPREPGTAKAPIAACRHTAPRSGKHGSPSSKPA
jgi:hypothetical protein